MEANHIAYDYLSSIDRINEILDASNDGFEEVDSIPARSRLTFTNGFYVNCTALFVDIRGSSTLPEKHTRPVLAKIYRAYLSEVAAVMNGNAACAEINITGDSVSGIFDTPYQTDINDVFGSAAQVSSVVDILNCRLAKKSFLPISVGIGIAYGRALMIKAGYSGSSINDVVWMGEVVNQASKLCSNGSKNFNPEMIVSPVFYDNLNDANKALLSHDPLNDWYEGHVVNQVMEAWVNEKC